MFCDTSNTRVKHQPLHRLCCGAMPSYAIPSSPVPPSSSAMAEPEGPAGDTSIAGLAKRVSAYLARVVGALADFEDRLLCEDGFFAREEHFEAQIDSLRREFEYNKRAAVRSASLE